MSHTVQQLCIMALALTAGAFSCRQPDTEQVSGSTEQAPALSETEAAPEPLCGSLVYARSEGGEHASASIHMLELARGGAEPRTLGADGGHEEHADHEEHAQQPSRFPAAVSPDGTKLLVMVSEPTPSGKTADRLELWSLTEPDAAPESLDGAGRGAMIRNPSWSPDGGYIVYESDADSFRDIYRYDFAGDARLRLTDNEQGNFEATVGPGGRSIAFVSSRDGNAEIYVMSSDGGGALRLTSSPGDDSSPRWSPDGRRLAFISARERERGIDLYLLPVPGGRSGEASAEGTPQPIGGARSAPVMVRDHAWSPDGRALAWTELSGRAGESTKAALVAVEVDSGRELLRTQPEGIDEQPVWSPDARHLIFSRGERERARLFRVGVDGSGLAPLRPGETGEASSGVEWLPRWISTGCERVAPALAPPMNSGQG